MAQSSHPSGRQPEAIGAVAQSRENPQALFATWPQMPAVGWPDTKEVDVNIIEHRGWMPFGLPRTAPAVSRSAPASTDRPRPRRRRRAPRVLAQEIASRAGASSSILALGRLLTAAATATPLSQPQGAWDASDVPRATRNCPIETGGCIPTSLGLTCGLIRGRPGASAVGYRPSAQARPDPAELESA
jgi:hypothetical protein